MKFYTRKRKNPILLLVSLIDILAILLLFFIVTTTFKKSFPELNLTLPQSSTAQPANTPSEKFVLQVKSADEMRFDDQAISLDQLATTLQAASKKFPTRPLTLEADRAVPFGIVIQVLDILKESGIHQVSACTNPNTNSNIPAPTLP